jgi:hypothetical protein
MVARKIFRDVNFHKISGILTLSQKPSKLTHRSLLRRKRGPNWASDCSLSGEREMEALMNRKIQLLAQSIKDAVLRMTAYLEQPWRGMKLSADEIAERRRNRLERGEQNFLWCWQHRGFW